MLDGHLTDLTLHYKSQQNQQSESEQIYAYFKYLRFISEIDAIICT